MRSTVTDLRCTQRALHTRVFQIVDTTFLAEGPNELNCCASPKNTSSSSSVSHVVFSSLTRVLCTFFFHIPRIHRVRKSPRFNPLSATRVRITLMVRCVAGVCSLQDRMAKQSSWGNRRDGSHVPKKLLKFYVEMADENPTGGTFAWRESQKQRASILQYLW